MIRRRLVLGVACVGASVLVGVAAIRLARSGQPPHDQPPSAVRREASEYGNGVRSGGVASPGSVEPGHGVARPSVAPRRPPVPADLEAVFDGSADTIARMKAVDALHRGLSVDALSALRWLLRKPDEDEALRNNVANKLRQCGEPNLVADLTADDGDAATTAPIYRLGVRRDGEASSLREIVGSALGDPGVSRTDLRIAQGSSGEIYITTKQDGMVRTLTPIPEPGGIASLLAGAAFLAVLGRRRARS